MRINKKTTRNTKANSTFLDDILLEAEVFQEEKNGTTKGYINLQTQPKKVIWYADTGVAYVDENPQLSSGRCETTNLAFTHALYVPGEDIKAARASEALGLETPLNPSASIDEWVSLLNLKLAQANRELSIWDTYNIYKVAYNDEDLASALASLPLSSSVLVNIDSASTSVGGWNLKKGDMICRDYLGNLHHVPGSNGGYYFPYKIEAIEQSTESEVEAATDDDEENTTPNTKVNGIFQILFKYDTRTPIDNMAKDEEIFDTQGGTVDIDKAEPQPYEKMILTFPELSKMEAALCYATSGSLSPSAASEYIGFKTSQGTNVQPIVYYYFLQQGYEERVYLPTDYQIFGTDGEKPSEENPAVQFKLSNPTSLTLKYEVR